MKINFSKYSSIKIGPTADVLVIDESVKIDENVFIVGGANNLLISNNPPPLAMLDKKYDFIYIENNSLHIGAATASGKILSFAKKHNINGFEILQKLPGQLGGMLKMNAGLKGFSISDNVLFVKTFDRVLTKEECGFGYRTSHINSLIYEAIFEIKEGFDTVLFDSFKKARTNQPNLPSAGSCFKNPEDDFAGRLLEECGYKGKCLNGVSFSDVHANFLVNYGGGTFEDALTLIKEAKNDVYKKFGVNLELEIQIVDKSVTSKKI
ncbi:MAG: UDP-N-acetylmuramate dehydrogenase [Campylobacteraceae bacterium]|jgi:UDP-N-acetylmuramate dehydrogenase|nr:UDP-N-acetylmuramate dehydrogenase [Campylobacteraceae bacterium]